MAATKQVKGWFRDMSHTPRTIWVVRHAEREDNINHNWLRQSKPLRLKADNSPLSKRGHHQAREVAQRFAKQQPPIDHIFASPFERTMETASAIVEGIGPSVGIKVEPGLLEALYLCEKPPSFESAEALKSRFPHVDLDYTPVFSAPLPKESYGDDSCCGRLQRTLDTILERYAEENLMLVSHGSPIGAIHQCLVGDWNYVGQATVSKFVEDKRKRGKFRLEFTSDASHLSDKSNLRAY